LMKKKNDFLMNVRSGEDCQVENLEVMVVHQILIV